MKKTGRLKQLLALILAGALTVGSVGTPVFGADFGDTVVESAVEDEALDGGAAGEAAEEESGAGAVSEDMDVPEDNEDSNVEAYTVTLDANGGYFENEWDDTVGDYVERAEVIEKKIPVGGTVAAVPVFSDQDGQTILFAGWSLEPNGELVSETEEEYVPVDNCVLYAVWETGEAEDASLGDTDEGAGLADTEQEAEASYEDGEVVEETEHTEEEETGSGDTEETESAQESEDTEETETAQEYEDAKAEEEIDSAQGYEDAEAEDPSQKYEDTEETENTNTAQESAENTETSPETENEQDDALAEKEIYSDGEEETVSTEASNGVVRSGEFPINNSEYWIWTLDSNGTLRANIALGQPDKYSSFKDYKNEIKSVIIMDGATYIPNYGFSHLPNCTSVSIPSSVVSIGEAAFYQCTNLKDVEIPSSVVSIGGSAFWDCSSLISITIPSSVASIGDRAFKGCTSLSNVGISNGVKEIGDSAFSGCNITSITIPSSVTSVASQSFL